jgi:hypothetical protein
MLFSTSFFFKMLMLAIVVNFRSYGGLYQALQVKRKRAFYAGIVLPVLHGVGEEH